MRRGILVCAAALLLARARHGFGRAGAVDGGAGGNGGRDERLPNVAPSAKTVDGSIADWRGRLPGFGGAVLYSRGELLYQDHLFDAWGADDGRDAQRLAVQDPLLEALPETYRIDPALQANLPGEFGAAGAGAARVQHELRRPRGRRRRPT